MEPLTYFFQVKAAFGVGVTSYMTNRRLTSYEKGEGQRRRFFFMTGGEGTKCKIFYNIYFYILKEIMQGSEKIFEFVLV